MIPNDFFVEPEAAPAGGDLLLATVGSYSSISGASLIFDGQTTSTAKRFKRLSTYTPTAGARVLVARIGGSYVILGAVVS